MLCKAAKQQGVALGHAEIIDNVETTAGHEHIRALTPGQRVVATAANQRVVARPAMQQVVASAAIEIILPQAAKQAVLPALPQDQIIADIPDHVVCQGIALKRNVARAQHGGRIDQIIGNKADGYIGSLIPCIAAQDCRLRRGHRHRAGAEPYRFHLCQ